jgi:hypothetical protein
LQVSVPQRQCNMSECTPALFIAQFSEDRWVADPHA